MEVPADLRELENKYLMYNVTRMPMVITSGKGMYLYDEEGKKYLDFVGGWAVDVLGHCPDVVVDAVCKQAGTLLQVSNQFYTVPQVLLGELLIKNTCFDKVMFMNSGAEANEAAVKLARKYGKVSRNGAYEVITFLHSFHGRTLSMVAATGKPAYQKPFEPMPSGFLNLEYNNLEEVKRHTTEKTVAIMLEPVQGEGGVHPADLAFLRGLRQWCDEQNLLLIFDEVQTGVARLGTLFGYQSYGVEPDVMTLAKGLGGGVPISALLAKQKAAVFEKGEHGTTFGGNPLATAAGLATMNEVINRDLPRHVKQVGDYLMRQLIDLQDGMPVIKEVRGMGLLVAVEFNQDIAADVVGKALDQNLLLNMVSANVVRLMPPCILEEAEVDQAVKILKDVISQVS